jgi:hypothetical protein
MSKTLIYLQELGLDDYELLTSKAEAVSESFRKRSNCVKEIETRLNEITTLQRHIGTYRKTRDTYKQYISLSPKKRKDFFETHRADITLHQAAKKYFDSTGLTKFPPMDDLKKEYAMFSVEKKKLSSGYKAEREKMIALLMAKQNVDRIFGGDHAPQKKQERGAR